MIRVVLDTNVLISAFASPKGMCGKIFDAWIGEKFEMATSSYIMDEFFRVAVSKLRFTQEEATKSMQYVIMKSLQVSPLLYYNPAIDQNDWPIIGTFLASAARFLVTGDKGLLQLKEAGLGKIIPPKAFYENFCNHNQLWYNNNVETVEIETKKNTDF